MLMLQALLPCMLADSKNREVEVIFKGGTNVCSPPGKGQVWDVLRPQVGSTGFGPCSIENLVATDWTGVVSPPPFVFHHDWRGTVVNRYL